MEEIALPGTYVSFEALSPEEKRIELELNASYIKTPLDERWVSLVMSIKESLRKNPSTECAFSLNEKCYSGSRYRCNFSYSKGPHKVDDLCFYDPDEVKDIFNNAGKTLEFFVNPFQVEVLEERKNSAILRIS